MPQGRRKVPFSNKQKKAQLQSKREQKKARQPPPITLSARKPYTSDDGGGDIEDELDDDDDVATKKSIFDGNDANHSANRIGELTAHHHHHHHHSHHHHHHSHQQQQQQLQQYQQQQPQQQQQHSQTSKTNIVGTNTEGNGTIQSAGAIASTSCIVDQSSSSSSSIAGVYIGGNKIRHINAQKNQSATRGLNRYALQFFTESDQEIRERKERAQKPFQLRDECDGLVTSVEELFGEAVTDSDSGFPIADIDMPKRPPWSPQMTPQELNTCEQKYFTNYLNQLFAKMERNVAEKDVLSSPPSQLSYFELNLETWRQLWRVIEMSDIVLLVTDIRHPIFHFPPSLYHYVVDELHKDMIIVLNKIDLVDAGIVIAWREYLCARFPKLNVLEFASYAGMRVRSSSGKRVGKLRMAVKSAASLQSMVAAIVGDRADLNSWKQKIENESRSESCASPDDDDDSSAESEDEDEGKRYNKNKKTITAGAAAAQLERKAEQVIIAKADTSYYANEQRFKDGIVTIGCVGHPNVGKSSLLNALYGKKVVSVSRTPGHTKHFQTIFLTENVRLCDCPGLVFPSHAPKALQVLMGCFPIAQLREPYTAIGYVAERLNLVRLLRLQHPDGDTENVWSPYDICEAWAEKRGFLTARTARPDIYRAANHLLRMALDGRTICLAFRPPNYYDRESDFWLSHVRRAEIEATQNRRTVEETLNKNLIRQSHNPGYVDSHASSVEADVDEDDDDDDDADDSTSDFGSSASKFALLEVEDDDY